MSTVFGSTYAGAYDILYGDKDYPAECDLIEEVFQTCGDGRITRVLDLGCGTGTHGIELARRGYDVVGVDMSSDMLACALAKAAEEPLEGQLEFRQGDIRTVRLSGTFDAATVLFAVLGYQTENIDVIGALRNARRHLRPGGLLLFDVWYGPAVLANRPSQRVKEIPSAHGRIYRLASGTLDALHHRCTVDYHLRSSDTGGGISETRERHEMRFFFARELELFLDVTGFSLVRLGQFPDWHSDPDENTWNIMGVARAVGNE